jgi:hypothetical protein
MGAFAFGFPTDNRKYLRLRSGKADVVPKAEQDSPWGSTLFDHNGSLLSLHAAQKFPKIGARM